VHLLRGYERAVRGDGRERDLDHRIVDALDHVAHRETHDPTHQRSRSHDNHEVQDHSGGCEHLTRQKGQRQREEDYGGAVVEKALPLHQHGEPPRYAQALE